MADIAELFGQLQQADFGANDLLILWSLRYLLDAVTGLCNPDQLRPVTAHR